MSDCDEHEQRHVTNRRQSGVREGEMCVVERTSRRAAIRSPADGLVVVTNDYRAMDVATVERSELQATACARYDRALAQALRTVPSDAEAAFAGRLQSLGLESRVVAHGGVPHAHVKRFVLDADLLLFPSTHPSEALPVAVLEALNAGTPVVGVAHAALPEIIRDGAGTLVPPDADALADAAEALADPGAWALASRAARARFDAAYGPDAVRQMWLSLLDRVA